MVCMSRIKQLLRIPKIITTSIIYIMGVIYYKEPINLGYLSCFIILHNAFHNCSFYIYIVCCYDSCTDRHLKKHVKLNARVLHSYVSYLGKLRYCQRRQYVSSLKVKCHLKDQFLSNIKNYS